MKVIIFLAFALFLQGALGVLVCEELPVGLCSFSVTSSGKRCLLETYFVFYNVKFDSLTGELDCEELPIGLCSFSIAFSGKRCLLETYASNDGTTDFKCRTSEVLQLTCTSILRLMNVSPTSYAHHNVTRNVITLLIFTTIWLWGKMQSSSVALGSIAAAGSMSTVAHSPSSPVDCVQAPV
ncbi:unnamed protein product [Fraxinus pennsylvanica]|uniref:Uncharacterized protein n=1 Tax=Fraxinus pennsylvanica TaxID=56036 RepID=A0AAD2A525_9LAMI|nr:unnamed protein product [Fraxinus pennsylvanica]